jgi:hypothetical protein
VERHWWRINLHPVCFRRFELWTTANKTPGESQDTHEQNGQEMAGLRSGCAVESSIDGAEQVRRGVEGAGWARERHAVRDERAESV